MRHILTGVLIVEDSSSYSQYKKTKGGTETTSSLRLKNSPTYARHVYDYEKCFISNGQEYDRSNSFAFNYVPDGIQFGS